MSKPIQYLKQNIASNVFWGHISEPGIQLNKFTNLVKKFWKKEISIFWHFEVASFTQTSEAKLYFPLLPIFGGYKDFSYIQSIYKWKVYAELQMHF